MHVHVCANKGMWEGINVNALRNSVRDVYLCKW